jgi:hypothetical protein
MFTYSKADWHDGWQQQQAMRCKVPSAVVIPHHLRYDDFWTPCQSSAVQDFGGAVMIVMMTASLHFDQESNPNLRSLQD